MSSTIYPYVPYSIDGPSKLFVYTGSPVSLNKDGESPPNTTKWMPPATSPGVVAYWWPEIGAWCQGIDIANVPFTQLQTMAMRNVNRTFQLAISGMTGSYTPTEQQTWAKQEADARALIANGTPSSFITTLADAGGVTPLVLAQSIVAKADAYHAAYATALANYKAERSVIEKATSLAQLPAFTIEDVRLGS